MKVNASHSSDSGSEGLEASGKTRQAAPAPAGTRSTERLVSCSPEPTKTPAMGETSRYSCPRSDDDVIVIRRLAIRQDEAELATIRADRATHSLLSRRD